MVDFQTATTSWKDTLYEIFFVGGWELGVGGWVMGVGPHPPPPNPQSPIPNPQSPLFK